jgi:hypothetical protein
VAVPPVPDVVSLALPEPIVELDEPVALDEEPEGMVPLVAPVLPLAPVPPVLPPGVPVVPMGVFCELCWPAPVAGLGLAGLGGVLWATAVPTTATVAKPASSDFSAFDVFIG